MHLKLALKVKTNNNIHPHYSCTPTSPTSFLSYTRPHTLLYLHLHLLLHKIQALNSFKGVGQCSRFFSSKLAWSFAPFCKFAAGVYQYPSLTRSRSPVLSEQLHTRVYGDKYACISIRVREHPAEDKQISNQASTAIRHYPCRPLASSHHPIVAH